MTPRDSVRSLSRTILWTAFLMPSGLARVATFLPIVGRIRDAYGLSSDSNFSRAAYLIVGHVNPIASMALMTGGGMPIIALEVIGERVGPLTWVEWGILMIPPTVVLYLLATVAASRVYSIEEQSISANGTGETTLERPEPMNREQRIVSLVMIATIAAWIVGSFIGIPTILPAIFAVAVLAAPRVEIITSDDIGKISWNILFLIGTMFSILGMMTETGTFDVMVGSLTQYIPFEALHPWQVVVVLLAMTIGLRLLFSSASAALIVILPIVLEFGLTFGVNGLFLGLSVLIAVGSSIILPFHNTTVLLSFDKGPLSLREVAGFGVLTTVLGSLVIALSWLVYWPLVT